MPVTRSNSYGPGLLGPLTHRRRHTKKYAAKLLAKREADAMKRLEENRVISEKLHKERDEAIGEEELARRKAAVAKIQEESLAKLEKMLKALKVKEGGSRKNKKRSNKTKRRGARK
jgi:hypothetical protein